MMRWRVTEFFESDEGSLSMTRLLCFMSFFPASYVVIERGDEGILGWYLGAYVISYVGGKGADALQNRTVRLINKRRKAA